MSKIEELIKEKCPDGVEFRKLEDCCNILDKKRKPVTKSAREAGEYPYYGANGIQDYVSDFIFDGTFVLVGEDGSVITPNGTPVVTWATGKIWVNNHAHIIEEIEGVDLRYMFHYLQTVYVGDLIHGNIPKLNQGDFRQIEIAVPPIEVQQEIVRILDKFTALDAGLNDELNNRRKQYLYAMDELVAHRADVMDITVGDAFDIITDYTAAGSFADLAKNVIYSDSPDYAQLVRTMDIKSKFTKGSPVYVSESAFKYLWRVNLDSEAVILPNIGANCGEVYYVVPEDLPYENNVLGPNAILARSTKYNNRYLAYTLQTPEFQRQLRKIISPAGQTKFNKTDLKKLTIKVPSIEEQEKIVEVLDRFDVLCNDSKLGLPAEIEARRKQYEYYRDKLLTFERKVV